MSSFDFNNNNKLSEIKERYLDFNKKQYYLESVDENVDMLQKKQINDLTNF
jgi:hypothetical protein